MKKGKNSELRSAFSTEDVLRIIEIIVKKFIKNGSVFYEDYDEMKQILSEKYWRKQDKIIGGYSGKAKPATYLSAVFYRMVLEVLRNSSGKNDSFRKYEKQMLESEKPKSINPEEEYIIKNELKLFKRVLETFGEEKPKVQLFCKMYFKQHITEAELTGINDGIPERLKMKLLADNSDMKDKEIYALLCELVNLEANKKVKQDAVRMYIKKSIKNILERLNYGRRAFYTENSLEVLFDMAFNIEKNTLTQKEDEKT